MKRAILLMSLALPLAACGSKPTVDEKNASVEQVANSVREASRNEAMIRPGKWQSTMTIEDMDMPGMPPETQAQMRKMFAQARVTENCVTPEEARQPQPKMFAGSDQCRYDHFTMGNGKIDAEMHCNQQGVSQTMTMAGTYGPEAYAMHMSSKTEGGPAGEAMSMKMKVEAKRIGDCSGKET
ncbi:MAG TPA: DUF3617 domain-containing protein [Sphingomicrobium sp.]|jgi:hypothetical protein|nr:DUF3617 domain-containing protein [Sphingomicrobium sp.]